MPEYTEVEQPFLQQLASLGWTIIDQGREIPQDPVQSLRQSFRQWLLPDEEMGQVYDCLNLSWPLRPVYVKTIENRLSECMASCNEPCSKGGKIYLLTRLIISNL